MRRNPGWSDVAERDAFKALDNYRHIVADENMHLKQQNSDLRHRVGKLSEIQARIEGLLLRDDHNMRQIQSLRMQNHNQRLKAEELRNYLEMERASKVQIEQRLKAQIQQLTEQLRWIATDAEQIKVQYESAMNDLKVQTAKDMQTIKLEIVDTQHQNRMHMDNLTDALRVKSLELEQKERQWTATRRTMLEDIQELQGELERMQREVPRLMDQNRSLVAQCENLKQGLQSIKANNQTLMLDKIRADQEWAQLLLDINDGQSRLEALLADVHTLEQSLVERGNRLAESELLRNQLGNKLKDLQSQIILKNRCIDDLRLQMLAREDSATRDLASFSLRNAELEDVIAKLRTELTILQKQSPHLRSDINNKTSEIKDLLYGIERLEEKLLQLESRNRDIELEKMDLQEKLSVATQELENCKLDKRTLQDKLTLKESHVLDLETLLKKQQMCRQAKEVELLEQRKLANNPQRIIEKYEEEMLRMIKLFEEEKLLMQQQWDQEKKRLRETYDFELRDVQELFQRKLRVFQG